MPGSAHHSGQRVQDPRSSLSGPQTEGAHGVYHLPGDTHRHGSRPAPAATREAVLPLWPPARIGGPYIFHVEGTGIPSGTTQPHLQSRAFRQVILRRMFDQLHSVKLPSHSSARMRLSRGFRSDLDWWQEFVLQWNGVSFLSLLPPASARHVPRRLRLVGCGAWHQSHWLQVQWGPQSSIAEKELVPIILACDLWGRAWQGRCHCDNQVVVACLRSRTSKSEGYCVAWFLWRHNINVTWLQST